MQKGYVPILVAVFVLILALLGVWGGIYLLSKSTAFKSSSQGSMPTYLPQQASHSAVLTPTPSVPSSASPSSTPDETAFWKVYEDSGLGFSIKYPPNGNFTISKADNQVFFQSGKARVIWTINIQTNNKKLELFDWLKNNYYGIGYLVLDDGTVQKPAQKDITVSPSNIASQEAFEVQLSDKNPLYNNSSSIFGYSNILLTPDKSKVVIISSNVYDSDLNKALKTFKFLSANPTEVSWYEAIEILNSGKVVSILQTQNLDVKLTLNDKSAVITKEAKIDDIFKELSACQVCKGKQISVATE